MKVLVLFITFCAFLSNPFVSFATDFSHAQTAKINGNYEEAVNMFTVAAEKGDKHAQHCLGVLLHKGLGVRQNHEESLKWLELAAKQGLSQAKFELGILIYSKRSLT